MLQYPVQLPPLSLSSPKHKDSRPNDLTKRLPPTPRQPLATNLSPPPSPHHQSYFPPTPSTPVSLPTFAAWKATNNHSTHSSLSSLHIEDVLLPGDILAEGASLQGETIRRVPSASPPDIDEPASEFQVVRRLGTGSYAVVYLVREVLSRPFPSDDGHLSVLMGSMDFDNRSLSVLSASVEYGKEYAVKCLSKANLDEEALAAQLSEVSIHQSLRPHPNIVTLHRTLETPSFLLLLLEFVPGEDLFYFLEQARDHHPSPSHSPSQSLSSQSISSSRTPPTPSLLSALAPSQLLSKTRLKLIASMFAQMCEAVAECHDQSVFHRDIKPENFIVTDGWSTERERRVVVKLTDFGLSTTDVESSDMDCGSAPYMSYECRNNVAPTYKPRAADVWSLGIVLINMLYHYNPWTDTAQGTCSSFDLYLSSPVSFFMHRFTGMTRPVAEFFAFRVFCLLPSDADDKRISAREFGVWVRDLPALLGEQGAQAQAPGHKRVVSTSSTTQGHRLSASIPSHRPVSRQASLGVYTPALHSRSLSRAPSFGAAPFEGTEQLPTVIDQEVEEQVEEEQEQEEQEQDGEEPTSRSQSTTKRRKRGARKGKGTAAAQQPLPYPALPQADDATLETLASASQSLAREISRASRSSSKQASMSSRGRTRNPPSPPSMYPLPLSYVPPPPPSSSSSPVPPASVGKKSSKWKLSFGKNSSTASVLSGGGAVSPVDDTASIDGSSSIGSGKMMSATASNVTNLIMGLNAPPPPSHAGGSESTRSSSRSRSRGRDRRPKPPSEVPPPLPETLMSSTWGPSTSRAFSPSITTVDRERWPQQQQNSHTLPNDKRSERGVSPTSTRSGRPLASSGASSISTTSGNWRSSMSTTSSAGTSTSAFTRYSNSSRNSVSTAATSVSASSWRAQAQAKQGKGGVGPGRPPIPSNVKFMTGVPWELDELPRHMHPNPSGDIFGQPPVRKQRQRKPKDLKLDTINERERPGGVGQKSPPAQRQDAMTSTTDLDGVDEDGVPKKVQKGQINALAKMLSALRR